MSGVRRGGAALAVLLAAGLWCAVAPAGPTKKTLPPRPGLTTVFGEKLVGVLGQPIARLRLYAMDDDGFARPIPFQVDERDARGFYVLAGGSPELRLPPPANDSDHNLFDENDELVFVPNDAGGRAPASETFLDAAKVLELELADGPRRGWVYLAAYARSVPPAASPAVSYDAAADAVAATLYALSHRPGAGEPLPSGLRLAGGDGLAILDQFVLRLTLRGDGRQAPSLAEGLWSNKLAGTHVGPARVLRRTESAIKFLGGLPEASCEGEAQFHREGMVWRGRLTWTTTPGVKSALLQAGLDLNSAAAGMHWLTPGRDWVIDGRRTQAASPRAVALPPTFPAPPWMGYAGHGMTLLFQPRLPNAMAPQKLEYRDDARFPAGQEPGAWGQALYQYEAAKGKTTTVEFGFQLLFAKGEGEAPRLAAGGADALSKALTVTAREAPGRAAP